MHRSIKLMILSILTVWILAACSTETPTPTPLPTTKDFVVTAINTSSNTPVPQIEISIKVDGLDDVLNETTENSGKALFRNVISEQKTNITISVFDSDFERFEKLITVDKDNPSLNIDLTPLETSSEATSQKNFIVTAINNATNSPIPQVEISLTVEGLDTPLNEITEISGIALFSNVISDKQTKVTITVSDTRFEPYTKIRTVDKNNTSYTINLIPKDSSSQPTEETTDTFSFQIRAEAEDTSEPIENADVTIELGELAPRTGVTGSNGVARIFIPDSHANKPGTLIVESPEFARHQIPIDLLPEQPPTVIKLKRVDSTTPIDTPSPTPTHTHTPSPTSTSTPTPTNTPTNEPPTATPTDQASSSAPTSTPAPPPPPAGKIVLLSPITPTSLQEPTFGLTEFKWQWNGELGEDQGFEIRLWREGEPPQGIHNSVQDNSDGTVERLENSTYRLVADITDTAPVQRQSSEYNWTVLLVQIKPEYKELSTVADNNRLRYEFPSSGGTGDGGGGDGDRGDPGPLP